MPSNRNDRVVGAVCLVACPMISGAFLGLVATLCVYPAVSGHAVTIGALVGVSGFVANAIAICLTAVATERRAHRRARHATAGTGTCDIVAPHLLARVTARPR